MRKFFILVAVLLTQQAFASTYHYKPDIPPASNYSSSNIWKSVELKTGRGSAVCDSSWLSELYNNLGFTREYTYPVLPDNYRHTTLERLVGTYSSEPFVLTPGRDPIELFRPTIECTDQPWGAVSFPIDDQNLEGFGEDLRGFVTVDSFATYEDESRGPRVYATIEFSFADTYSDHVDVNDDNFYLSLWYLKKGAPPFLSSSWKYLKAEKSKRRYDISEYDIFQESIEASVPYPTLVRLRVGHIKNETNWNGNPRKFMLRNLKFFTEYCDLEDSIPDNPGGPPEPRKCK